MFLLDTNVISELRKNRPHGAVLAWRRSMPLDQLAIPAVVIGEIQAGAEITRRQDREKAAEIESWLNRVMNYYRILPMDGEAFRELVRLIAGKPTKFDGDAMIAATARVHDCTIATRNTKHFRRFSIEVFDPFTYAPGMKN